MLIKCIFVGPPKKDRKQSIKNRNNRSLSFHFDFLGLPVCGFVTLAFVRFSGCPLISHELLDKTYMRGLNDVLYLSFQRIFLA